MVIVVFVNILVDDDDDDYCYNYYILVFGCNLIERFIRSCPQLVLLFLLLLFKQN